MIALLAGYAASAWAQYPDPFLTDEQRPDGTEWIVPPPEFTSGEFANDFYFYQWGKKERETEWSAEQAVWDEGVDIAKVYGTCLGFQLTKETTPEIIKLAEAACTDATQANKLVKNYYQRVRPFAVFKEQSLIPEADDEEANTFSYPSGHASRGWMYALVLATVAPECTEKLMSRARLYALYRVVCGHHWKSDIDASLMLIAGVFANVVVTEGYQEQLKKARAEYKQVTSGLQSIKEHKPEAATKSYDLQGRPLNNPSEYTGIYIENGTKKVSK